MVRLAKVVSLVLILVLLALTGAKGYHWLVGPSSEAEVRRLFVSHGYPDVRVRNCDLSSDPGYQWYRCVLDVPEPARIFWVSKVDLSFQKSWIIPAGRKIEYCFAVPRAGGPLTRSDVDASPIHRVDRRHSCVASGERRKAD